MYKIPSDGLIISFDGLECAGKGTYIQLLTKWLDDQKLEYVISSEPGGSTELGKLLRSTFMSYQGVCAPEVEVGLLAASFKNNEHRVIFPALEAGKIVIMDRTDLSTQAYQAGGCEYDIDMVLDLLDAYNLEVVPDLRFYLHVTPFESVRRMSARGIKNVMDQKSPEFYERCSKMFSIIAGGTDSITVIDTMAAAGESEEQAIERTFLEILDKVKYQLLEESVNVESSAK